MERVRTISRRDLVPYDSSARSSLLGVNRSRSLIKCNWNGRVVAVKFLTEDAQEDVLFERAQSWHSFPHQNVGQVLGVSDRACSPLFVVLPYYSNGNIIQFLARHPHFNRKSMILDIARGMQCLHSHDIIHGGLKPTNIMISDNMQVCITDFEMVRVQPSRNNESHRYFSPEAWKGLVSPASDVYAFAMSVYEILTSKVPWGSLSMKYIFQLVVGQNARPDRPETTDMTDKEWSIMEESWDKEPRLRPTFDIIIRMWQDPNEAAYSTRGGRYRRDNSLPLPPGSRWSDTTATSPPAYEPSSMTVPRPLPIPVQYSSTPSTAQSSRPHHSTDSGQYVSAHTELHSPPYTASSLSSSSASSSYSLFSPRIPLTPMSAPMGPPMQEAPVPSVPPVPVIGNPPFRPRGPSMDVQDEEDDSPVLGRFDAMRQALPSPSRTHTSSPSVISNSASIRNWQSSHRRTPPNHTRLRTVASSSSSAISGGSTGSTEVISIRSNTDSAGSGGSESSVLFLVGGLQGEMTQAGRSDSRIDSYMAKVYNFARESELNIHRLITAGVVNLLISLLRRRAASNRGLEVVLITLGVLSHDSISANLICRTQTAKTLIQLCSPRYSDEIVTLSLWCLNRICRNTEAASGLLKLDIVPAIKQLATEGMLPTMAVYCLGTLIQSDAHADMMESLDVIPYITRHLRRNSQNNAGSEDKCAGLYAIARLSRSIKLAKALARAGCIPLLTFNLRDSRDPDVLNWSARAIGCLMRPNSVDMARSLLDAGAAEGLARLPTVLAPGCLEPLESFGFAIQRFSCAEWGKATRVALLDAGVIDSLLAALRTAAIEPCNEVQAALALGISLLGDVGGSVIRREIVNAGGINILKDVGSRGSSDVSRACEMAVTSITGNVLTRNAASARTAMLHNWIGGCPDHQPSCPLELTIENRPR